ncbi:energy-coupling factor transporter transmembrane protein EcfT [Aquibacillus koreensis]|uniref:Energy-coupling factor transporter transmembrane protein EcfT n=1 Tax=Aquibacillus koreensis TaxID=279446 RepID=A0A9X3WRG6_9BACI|nr:energy-coupling factor transporter transmembrane component T [Aquibacillus koreensis]MCT2534294.1 energy-coupling factor transporter transmembrane protein EcfT [Aquibacillus koreensis]MDC3422371.1 energy-coupling factor transporter transmembrane protein EcfT [Aquibacillus koreensis]
MNKLILGRYFPGESWVHQLDPRAKIVAAVYFIFVLFLANNWQTYVLLWAFTFIAMRYSQVPIRIYLRGVRPLLYLILFTVFLQILFTAGGKIYFEWGPIVISEYGLINGFYIFCRFVMIIFVSTVVTLTTKPIDLTDGINALLKPLRKMKVPVDEIALMLSISLRFIPNLLDETQKVMDAQRARGTEFGEGSLLKQMKTLVPIFLPLFVSSLNRAEEMANVMEVRGYQSGATRSSFRQLYWKHRDSVCLCVMITLTLGLLWLRNEGLFH